MNNPMMHTPIKQLADAAILAVCFAFNAMILDADTQAILIAVIGSISGAVILAYFRRDISKVELFFKVLASSIGGLVLGTVLQEYLHVEPSAYRLGIFFLCGMLALVVLRTLLNFTEKNSADLLRGIVQRVFNLQVKTEKTRRIVKSNQERIEKLEHKEGD